MELDQAMLDQAGFVWRQTYAALPERFYERVEPVAWPAPEVVVFNEPLARSLGLSLEALPPDVLARLLGGSLKVAGASDLAQAYAGHQFGGFTVLGDGRAKLLGEHEVPDGRLVDLQFKGSGPTAFSRRGDGLAGLGAMLREHLISEAMAALGVPTTRSLAVVKTGQPVRREKLLDGAVLTRVAASHLRVGTFEYFSAMQDEAGLKRLADYAIGRHDPELGNASDVYVRWLEKVVDRQAALIAQWQGIGFVHGVMNTDNMSLAGETIDYGPCAFMNAYDPMTVFSSIDHNGRYAYSRQPGIAMWNLARLAEALLGLISPDTDEAVAKATAVLEGFSDIYDRYWLRLFGRKLGLQQPQEADRALINDLLKWMHQSGADFTNTFVWLSQPSALEWVSGSITESALDSDSAVCTPPHCLPGVPVTDSDEDFTSWHHRWQHRLAKEQGDPQEIGTRMQQVNPALIPRNHMVEAALSAATEQDDFAPLHDLLSALASPFDHAKASSDYQSPPSDGDKGYRTFCGT